MKELANIAAILLLRETKENLEQLVMSLEKKKKRNKKKHNI